MEDRPIFAGGRGELPGLHETNGFFLEVGAAARENRRFVNAAIGPDDDVNLNVIPWAATSLGGLRHGLADGGAELFALVKYLGLGGARVIKSIGASSSEPICSSSMRILPLMY